MFETGQLTNIRNVFPTFLEQQSPSLFGTRDWFCGRQFSMGWKRNSEETQSNHLPSVEGPQRSGLAWGAPTLQTAIFNFRTLSLFLQKYSDVVKNTEWW